MYVSVVNYGQEWEVAEAHNVPTQYRAGLINEIHANIGIKIGLRSINITLKSKLYALLGL
jgi:dual oxidase maturation factor 1